MCGIIGSLGIDISEDLFLKAVDSLVHRGPDDSSAFIDKQSQTFLGHRRLAIIDLSEAGRQPFSDSTGRYQLVYNGEIYNYLELKEELKNSYSFQTDTDTEVLLAGYLQWGDKCVEHFNGMFAFAIWDTVERRLFSARDRLGIKPFFYTQTESTLQFASEIKALQCFQKFPPNENVIAQYLAYGFYDHTTETFFEGVNTLPAGHIGIWDGEKFEIKKYWDIRDAAENYSYGSPREVRETFRTLLEDSIRLRFRSDVPVGVNLSSGLDSNVLRAFAQKVTGRNVHLFTQCALEEVYNECSLVERILSSEEKKLWHQTMLRTTDFISAVNEMNLIQDQPYGGIPTIAYGLLHKSAVETGVTVLLEGQGVDEILAGYNYYRIEFIKDLWQNWRLGALFGYVWNSNGSFMSNILEVFRARKSTSADFSQDASLLTHADVLSEDVLDNARKKLNFEAPFNSNLLNAQYRDICHTKLPRVLRFNDHASMASSRELRVPYLDYRIVEFCFWLPTRYKIDARSQKILMRETFKDVLPEGITNKQKVAFGAVQTPWFRKYAKDFVYEILDSESFKQRPYWKHNEFRVKVKNFFNGEGENSFFIWQAINLELWLRNNVD